jgi:hypothetical protein
MYKITGCALEPLDCLPGAKGQSLGHPTQNNCHQVKCGTDGETSMAIDRGPLLTRSHHRSAYHGKD